MRRASPEVRTHVVIEDGAWVWRVTGDRGPSPNTRRGVHWSRHKRDRDKWRTLLLISQGFHEARAAWSSPARVVIAIAEWGPKRDRDNAIAANKRLFDALVHARIIPDDGPSVVLDTPFSQPPERPPWVIGNGRTPAVEIVVRPA